MPIETQSAVNWALAQTIEIDGLDVQLTKDTPHLLVDKVREYFNMHDVEYGTFSYDDLVPFFN